MQRYGLKKKKKKNKITFNNTRTWEDFNITKFPPPCITISSNYEQRVAPINTSTYEALNFTQPITFSS